MRHLRDFWAMGVDQCKIRTSAKNERQPRLDLRLKCEARSTPKLILAGLVSRKELDEVNPVLFGRAAATLWRNDQCDESNVL